MKTYGCEDCEWVGTADDMDPIKDVHDRVDTGELMAVGCCPECGSMIGCEDEDVPTHTLEICAKIMRQRGWAVAQKLEGKTDEEAFDAALNAMLRPYTKDWAPHESLAADLRVALTAADLVRNTALDERQLQFYRDVMCTAFEGGCVYWAEGRRVVQLPDSFDYVSYELRPFEDPETGWKLVSPEVLHQAVLKLQGPLEKQPFNPGSLGNILAGAALCDAGNIDANDADCLVQFAVLGSLVYG